MANLNAHIQGKKLPEGNFPPRPDYGNEKKKDVRLWANYFEMNLQKPSLVLYLYTMKCEVYPPKGCEVQGGELPVPVGKKLMQVVRCALEAFPFKDIGSNIATDFSQILISSQKLEPGQMETGIFKFWAEHERDEEGIPRPREKAIRFKMILDDSGELDTSKLNKYLASESQGEYEKILPIVQALDIILGHRRKTSLEVAIPKQGKCFPCGTMTAGAKFDLEGPKGYLEGVRGFFASVRATTDRTMVNCNACCGAFYKSGPLVTLFRCFLPDQKYPNHRYTEEQYKKLEKAIEGLRVVSTHLRDENGRPVKSIRTICGLARPYQGPLAAEFHYREKDEKYTVARYWKEKGYPPIPNTAYPVINVGNKNHPILLPPHVCEIFAGQMTKTKLNPKQTEDMVRGAVQKPEETISFINSNAFRVLHLQEDNITLDSFGLSLKSDMVKVRGRVLNQPSLFYRNSNQVFKAGQLKNWGVLRITRNVKNLDDDKAKFDKSFSIFRTAVENTFGTKHEGPLALWQRGIDYENEATLKGNEDILKEEFERAKKRGISFLMIVLPEKLVGTYKQIKRLGDVEFGIITVCVVAAPKKFYKEDKEYCANVALKINLKLEGTNHVLEKPRPLYDTTMVIGIDVTHPSPGRTKTTAPSVAAMVASVDNQLSQWPVDLRINTSGKEMVDLLGPMLTTRLELWKKSHKGQLPKNLLIYRDGVSEGQYNAVLAEELEQLRNTCKVMYRDDKIPNMTLVVVGKRHHTRFFNQGQGHCTNPEYGTVVDTTVTDARNWDFFLQSHHALQGTARPAHYFVLLNEIFTKEFVGPRSTISDYLQRLTYEMCFLFGRSTGAVSIPPPVYYADLACERSRCYGDFDDAISDTSSMTGHDRGKPQLRFREIGSGPGHTPSKQVPGSAGSKKKPDSSAKKPQQPPPPTANQLPNMANLTKKERARLFEARINPNNKGAAEGSSKAAEGKKPDTFSELKAAQMSGKQEGSSKAEGKKPEAPTPAPAPSRERAAVEVHPSLRDKMFYV